MDESVCKASGDKLQEDNLAEVTRKNFKGELIIIDLPPPPEDICRVCDPCMSTNLRIAIVSTICCWLPLGILPVIFGLISIKYALKAKNTKDETESARYSGISSSIAWIGMMLFVTVLTIATVIIATCGIL